MRLYNTLTRQIDELHPLNDDVAKLYTCGLTVYGQPHIGNWLGYIYWDVLVRALMAEGYRVERTQNITDVGHLTSDDDNGEDKMEKGARAEQKTAWDIAAKYIAVAEHESQLLGLLPPSHLVRATETIAEQIAFAKQLDEKGFLYKIEGDGMYFDTSKFPKYGRLARLDIDGLEAGARVSVEGKRNITDFAVWKFSPSDGTKRDMEWESPWGIGFPGWHLECSVIAHETLGDQLDIHTGGIDHIPVHHINEIAQTEALTGTQFSQFWVHNNHLKADGQKMSKSLGNIYTLQDILDRGYTLDAFRVFSYAKHYRTEGNFTWENLAAAANRLKNWREAMALLWQPHLLNTPSTEEDVDTTVKQPLIAALSDDLNTVKALQLLDQLAASVLAGERSESYLTRAAKYIEDYLGLHLTVPDINDEQKALITQREAARTTKDWEAADALREQLLSQGIGLRDSSNGAAWYWI